MISAADLARRLARDAEAVCRHYLSNGHRQGHYWVIGDVMNAAGRSLYVRLTGPNSGPGAAGKWTDAASPREHGDLLDLIRLNRNLRDLGEAMDEARRFLAMPRPPIPSPPNLGHMPPAAAASSEAARRLFRAGHPVPGTLAEAYLRARGITGRLNWPALRYHPSVNYHETDNAPLESWPALLAAVTDLDGNITGIQRTWLERGRPRVGTPRLFITNQVPIRPITRGAVKGIVRCALTRAGVKSAHQVPIFCATPRRRRCCATASALPASARCFAIAIRR